MAELHQQQYAGNTVIFGRDLRLCSRKCMGRRLCTLICAMFFFAYLIQLPFQLNTQKCMIKVEINRRKNCARNKPLQK